MDELHKKYNIEKLSTQRKRNLLKIMYKESRDTDNINYRRPQMELRSQSKVKMKSNFTAITKVYMSPLYRGLRLWDTLPTDLQNEKGHVKFKKRITHINL